MSDVLKIEPGVVAKLVIDRPEALNALNPAVLKALSTALQTLTTNEETRAIIITGAGEKAFVAGADIRVMAEFSRIEITEYISFGQRVMQEVQQCALPVIAMVNGYALGGGLELALACDFIIASDAAQVGLPEVSLGIIPGFGGTQRLIARSGAGVARRLVLAGDMLNANQAMQLNVVDQVVPHSELTTVTEKLAQTIASRGPLAVRAARQVMNAYAGELLSAGLQREKEAFIELFETDDRTEGMAAFLEKRSSKFTGT